MQEDIGTIVRELSRQRSDVIQERMRAERYLEQVKVSRTGSAGRGPMASSTYSSFMRGGDPAGGGMETHAPATAAQLDIAEADVGAAKAKIAGFDERIASQRALQSRLVANFDRWLEDLPAGVKLEEFRPTGAARKAAKGSPTVADIDASRQRIAALKSEIHTVRSAPPPSSDVKAKMRAQVAALAERARPNYLGAIEAGHPIKFPELSVQSQVATPAGIGIAYISAPDVYGFLCWLHGDAIVARMESDIDELADDEGALSDEEKAQREKQILADILDIERTEEAIIEQLETSGAPIQRRDDADPRAVLGLSDDLPGPTAMF